MAIPLGRIVFWSVLGSTPLALWLFAARWWGGGFWYNLRRLAVDYRYHWLLFFLIVIEKNWVDRLNDPIRGIFGDFTWLLWSIEGTLTQSIQRAFEAAWLTAALNVHYLWMYVFLNYFSVILFAYRDDRELANLAALNYSVIYILSIPFYIFFNVQVTSDYIPGMDALLYNSGAGFFEFFIAHDPLDNAFPSLHIAIPFGLILVTWWSMRRRGYSLRDWEHRHFLWFVIANTSIFAFSILYLGIHWAIDIPGGLLMGYLGAIIVDENHRDFFAFLHRMEKRVVSWLPLGVGRRA